MNSRRQPIIAGSACTRAEPKFINRYDRYEFPHDCQQDDTYADSKVHRKRW